MPFLQFPHVKWEVIVIVCGRKSVVDFFDRRLEAKFKLCWLNMQTWTEHCRALGTDEARSGHPDSRMWRLSHI